MALLAQIIKTALERRFDINDYLVWSTICSVFMLVHIAQISIDIFLGYPIILLNLLILLVLDRVTVHRNHLIALAAVSAFSLISAQFSGTPLNSMLAQVAGISVMSVYYFNALTGFGLTVSRWIDLYARTAFILAVYGLLLWITLHVANVGDGRLKAIFSEPSIYIYTTLPALGYFVNIWINERRYGAEAAIFLLSYVCADSSLGFLGIMLILFFAFIGRLNAWQMTLGALLSSAAITALYFLSSNFRLRGRDTILALAAQDLSDANASTYAFLSNAYVAIRAFLENPLLGVGIGGYQYIYQKYIMDLTDVDPRIFNLQLNMFDANSLFLRVAAELGLPGLVALFGFLIVCARVKGTHHLIIRNALLPYMLIRMGRFGAYFSVEMYFFIGIYLLNYLNSRTTAAARAGPGETK